jgi:hypothetical protein
MQVNVARPMIADKIVFLIFMPQFSSAQAASQETLGSEAARQHASRVRSPRMKACACVTALSQ